MIYALTEAPTFRSVTFRVSFRKLSFDFKRTLHGSLLRKLTPSPYIPHPAPLRGSAGAPPLAAPSDGS